MSHHNTQTSCEGRPRTEPGTRFPHKAQVLLLSGRRAGLTVKVDLYIFVCIHFAILRKLAISRGLKFALLILLPICDIIQVIVKLYIFLRM